MVLPSEETDDHRNHDEHEVKVKGMRQMQKWEQKGNESKNKTIVKQQKSKWNQTYWSDN